MTPEERAEKILLGMPLGLIHPEKVRFIASEIREAVEDAFRAKGESFWTDGYREELIQKAKAEAYEEAAKIVQKWIDNDCVGPNPANLIRALKEKI